MTKTKNAANAVEVGKRVKHLRKSLGLKQVEFAQKLGIGNSYLSGIEKGLKSPKVDFFYKLAIQFNISLDYLFFGLQPMNIYEKIIAKKDKREKVAEVVTLEDLLWYMRHSTLFRDTIMSYASKFQLDNEGILRRNIENTMKREKEE